MLRSRISVATLLAGALLATSVASIPALAAPTTATVSQDAAAERAAVRAQKAEVASQVDTMSADKAEIDAALADINENVAGQEALVVNAQRAWEDADRRATESEQHAADRAAEVAALESRLASAAVDSYVSPPGQDMLEQFKANTATEYAQKQALLGSQANHTGDVIDQLRVAKYGLEREKEAAEKARADAIVQRDAAVAQIEELKVAQAQQQQFASGLEERLNAKLAEAASLESLDAELAAQIRAEQQSIVDQLKSIPPTTPAPAPPPPSGPGTPPPTTPPPTTPPPNVPVPELPHPDTTWVYGIQVATSMASQTAALIEAARADGISLTGNGYRSSDQQIALRRQNCGPTNWDIYYKPVYDCWPWTAIPGTSNHEKGLAIDFNGMPNPPSAETAAFKWMQANAGRFNFCNLVGERWHWSPSCR